MDAVKIVNKINKEHGTIKNSVFSLHAEDLLWICIRDIILSVQNPQ